jgi:CRP/FNR family transcriptional regulator, anaerobic regulatory protein
MRKNGTSRIRVTCHACPLRLKPCFERLEDAELDFLEQFKTGELFLERDSQIVSEGTSSPHLFTVLEGAAVRYKTLEDGRRQVIGFVLPGDFVGLQSAVMEEMHHSVAAMTAMHLCVFNRNDFYQLYREQPKLGYNISWLAAREEHFLGDHLITVGRRSALERLAFAICRLHQRARDVGMATERTMDMPFTQQDMADALGLSLVHTNKTLGRLRTMQVMSWHARRIEIHDRGKLLEIANLEPEPPTLRPLI